MKKSRDDHPRHSGQRKSLLTQVSIVKKCILILKLLTTFIFVFYVTKCPYLLMMFWSQKEDLA